MEHRYKKGYYLLLLKKPHLFKQNTGNKSRVTQQMSICDVYYNQLLGAECQKLSGKNWVTKSYRLGGWDAWLFYVMQLLQRRMLKAPPVNPRA